MTDNNIDQVVSTIVIRDALVDQLRNLDMVYNIPITQQARYSQPIWELILGCVPTRNESEFGVTANDILTALESEGYNVTLNAVRCMLHYLSNPEYAINPSRRLIGKKAFKAVKDLGGLKVTDKRGNQNVYMLGSKTRKEKTVSYMFDYPKTNKLVVK